MTKQELIKLGLIVLADNPELTIVLVTADGQVFEPGKRWAAESHARQNELHQQILEVKREPAKTTAPVNPEKPKGKDKP